MLITPDYQDQNAKMHHDRKGYGANGHKKIPIFWPSILGYDPQTILDYGCGKGTVKQWIDAQNTGIMVTNYDPAIEGASMKKRADVVICLDVLEHIEPECIDDVLDDIRNHAGKALFATICTRPAKKFLPDGRNAHLLVQTPTYWIQKISTFFTIVRYYFDNGHQEIMLEAMP